MTLPPLVKPVTCGTLTTTDVCSLSHCSLLHCSLPMPIVDAHEDIAWNALVLGRDVRRSALETRRLEENTDIPQRNGLCMVGLPEWLAGGVAIVCGSIFVAPASRGFPEAHIYTTAEEAHTLAQAQLDFYHRLADECEQIALIGTRADLNGVLDGWENGSPKVGIIPLMEGADPIREPAEAEQWFERGVRLVSLSWKAGSCYAGGDAVPGPLTDAGRELLAVMADLGLILDVSHLAEEAFFEAVDRFEGRIVATHANPRARVPGSRQLSDEMIRRLVERDGVIGLVPYNRFLRPGWSKGDPKEAVTVADVAAVVDHVCQVVGDAVHAGLGSDFDGGFGAESAPAELDTVADLARIGPALAELGYGEEDIAAVLGNNWLRVLRAALPE
nr:peptidase [Anaerolineae bacterium]